MSAELISSDRFIIKILDRAISVKDVEFQQRNLKALHCIFDDSILIGYLGKNVIKELESFYKRFPRSSEDEQLKGYLHSHTKVLQDVRHLFKMLRYSEDQKTEISGELLKLLKESALANKCNKEIFYKDTFKTNFLNLIELEIFLKSRYGDQIKKERRFDTVRPSIDLFLESLDKQFSHEYYW